MIFTTDNGAAFQLTKDGKSKYPHNAGMRGYKGSQYEGGHRVPFFIRWKDGKIEGGRDINQLAMNYDILPTLVSLCGINNHPDTGRDGRDLSPLMRQEVKDWPKRYCVVDNNRVQQPEKWRQCSVMDESWRLINGKELYDLSKDPGQEKNIASNYPEKVKDMRTAYENWWAYTSTDFGHYEAYKVGAPNRKETIITAHDLHTDAPVTWEQSYIRDPYITKVPSLGTGFWMIDVQREGEYEIALRRWPSESGLGFNSVVPALGKDSPWYEAKPAGVKLDIKKAILDIEGIHMEKNVDMEKKEITFKAYLSKGRQHLQAAFSNNENNVFAAFYVYIKKVE